MFLVRVPTLGDACSTVKIIYLFGNCQDEITMVTRQAAMRQQVTPFCDGVAFKLQSSLCCGEYFLIHLLLLRGGRERLCIQSFLWIISLTALALFPSSSIPLCGHTFVWPHISQTRQSFPQSVYIVLFFPQQPSIGAYISNTETDSTGLYASVANQEVVNK